MLKSLIVRLVETSTRAAWAVVPVALALAVYCTFYAARHFSVATDVRQLFPADLPWTQRADEFQATFPQYEMIAVVEAPTPEFAERASAELVRALREDSNHFRAIEEPQGGTFFKRNALLFASDAQLAQLTQEVQRGAPLIEALAADPSLRGVLDALSGSLAGVSRGFYSLDALAALMSDAADTAADVLANRPAHFSWRSLAGGGTRSTQTRFIEIAPVLDFKALEPGLASTEAIHAVVSRLDLWDRDQARVRLTGLAPMNDAQFVTLRENAAENLAVSLGAVLLILWLALRSWRIILAVVVSVTCGLAYSAALGLTLVPSLNLISVAFFVLFVGLAVDFGIQFSVRYRAERHETAELSPALTAAAKKAGWPLALAAGATALGFSAFLPTSYRGLSELGRIAGPGMIIAFLTSVTLLPALLRILNPPGEPRPMGFAGLAPIDRFLQRRRKSVILVTLGILYVASPLLFGLKFDFNTVHLQNPNADAVATFLALRYKPELAANAVEVTAPNLYAAEDVAQRLNVVRGVASTRTLASFVPPNQSEKLAGIRGLAAAIGPALSIRRTRPPPKDAENIAALRSTSSQLSAMANSGGPGAVAARRLAGLLEKLSEADKDARARATTAVVDPLKISLEDLRLALKARFIDVGSLPADLQHAWIAPDGKARVEILPKSDPDDTTSLRAFVSSVLAKEPRATGPAVMLYEAGNTVVRAFIEAGLFALGAIALLLWLSLGRLADVAMTLIPLLLAALLTLELCVLLDIPLNFTNIIAFPLLLGVGVAFKIYYVMAWRRGQTALVQSTLTRAVIFSAMTTATAFGSLWLSHHPGTSSMGKLMSLALVSTMLAAVLFQPALMGPPRKIPSDNAKPREQGT